MICELQNEIQRSYEQQRQLKYEKEETNKNVEQLNNDIQIANSHLISSKANGDKLECMLSQLVEDENEREMRTNMKESV